MKNALTFLRTVLCLFIAVAIVSCEKEELTLQADNFFFLCSEGADMPVWAKGSKASDAFIIYLHGGPGDEAHEERYKPLESDFVLLHRYRVPGFFLMGHSWGGGLATAYLAKGENKQGIKGWIMIDWAYTAKRETSLSNKCVMYKAWEHIQHGNKTGYWQGILNWYNRHAEMISDVYDKHADLVREGGGYFHQKNPEVVDVLKIMFFSPINIFIGNANLSYSTREMGRLATITVPSLILWGTHDGILPATLATDAYDALGNKQQELYLFRQKMKDLVYEHL